VGICNNFVCNKHSPEEPIVTKEEFGLSPPSDECFFTSVSFNEIVVLITLNETELLFR